MEWEIVRNENNEIIMYKLTDEIYIERELAKTFKGNVYYNHLIVNGKLCESTSGGYTLKKLKELGESRVK